MGVNKVLACNNKDVFSNPTPRVTSKIPFPFSVARLVPKEVGGSLF